MHYGERIAYVQEARIEDEIPWSVHLFWGATVCRVPDSI